MPQKRQYSKYLKYTGLVWAMLGIIGLGAFVGVKLDEKFDTQQPLFTAGCALIAVFFALVYVVVQLNKDTNADKDS